MNEEVMVELPATKLWLAVAQVTEDTSPFAREARLVADEVIRLRDAGQLSKTTAGEIESLIYQRRMHAMHSGDFQVTKPIEQLRPEIDVDKREEFPDVQVDPVQVHTRMAEIAAAIPLTEPEQDLS